MAKQPAWRRYLRLGGPDIRRDLDDEFEFHIAARAAEYVARGMSAANARDRAIAEFGDLAGAKRICQTIDEEQLRRHRRAEVLDGVRQDVRFALRTLRRTPAFAIVALFTLALGIGGTTAMFSVVHGVLLRPLGYADPDRLVKVWETSPQGDDHNVVAPANYLTWAASARSFAALGAHRWPLTAALTGVGQPVQVTVVDMTVSAMTALGVRPLIGRSFADDDALTGRSVILSHRMWEQRFGGDRGIVGRTVTLDDVAHIVVGVMPSSFEFPVASVELWRAMHTSHLDPNDHRSHMMHVIGRLRNGATIESAEAELRTIAARLTKEFPQFMTGFGVNVVPMHGDLVADVRPLLLVLLGGAIVVLLVACANIANLLLTRALAREREIAVRGALGAERSRLVQQLLTESALLGVTGGALGVAFGFAMLRALLVVAPGDVPLLNDVHLALPVLLFAAGVTVGSVMLFGLVPALRLARADLQATLRAAHDRGGGVRHARLRGALLVGEVALSLVLLTGAGLLLRSARRLQTVDYGYRPEGLVAVFLDLPRIRYDTTTRQLAFYQRLMERVRAIPGVAQVAGTTEPPASGFSMTFGFVIEGRPSSNPRGREDPQQLRVVTPEYFQTMGVPLVQGRTFDATDRSGTTAVVILNHALAHRYWPAGDAIGSRISLVGNEGPWMRIVGVVGDTRIESADALPSPALYMPYAQRRDIWSWMSWLALMVRARPRTDPHTLSSAIRNAVTELDPRLPVHRLATVEEFYGESLARRHFATLLMSAFAGMALLLGMVGMYGVLSYAVVQRQREIGIRIALGASRQRVVAGVLRHALVLVAGGVLIGSGIAIAVMGVLRSLLYEVSPHDPVTFVIVSLILAAVGALAALVPARAATRVDPLRVMRDG